MNKIFMLIFFTVLIFIDASFNKYLLSIYCASQLFLCACWELIVNKTGSPTCPEFYIFEEKRKISIQNTFFPSDKSKCYKENKAEGGAKQWSRETLCLPPSMITLKLQNNRLGEPAEVWLNRSPTAEDIMKNTVYSHTTLNTPYLV